MRYALLHRYLPGTGPQEATSEHDAEMSRCEEIEKELVASGAAIGGYALQFGEPVVAGTGVPATSEAVLFAVHVLDVPDVDAAVRWARRMPTVDYGTIEIRPLMA